MKDKLDCLIEFQRKIRGKKIIKQEKEDVCKELKIGPLELEYMLDQRRGELKKEG